MSSRDHAVVLGGSMAGLLAARVLSDHFARVTIVERDDPPAVPDHRRGVPQSRHAHALLPRGGEILERFLPGLMAALVADGAATGDAGTAVRMVTPAGPLPSGPAGAPFVGFSRPLLEWHVRARVTALPGVTQLVGHEATDLGVEDGAVTGAHVRARDTGDTDVLRADLVVDATGRGSRITHWLAELGYGDVPEETIETGIGYATRWYARPPGWDEQWGSAVVNVRVPDNPRAGLVLAVEDDRWTVTLAGFAGTAPPLDDEGFLHYARALSDPCVAQVIEAGTPLTPIRAGRIPLSRLRRFERMPRWPRGLLVTGDAVCAFNPMYGQGMTVSAMDALVLDAALRDTRPDLERRFRRDLARSVAGVWSIASGEDLRWDVASTGIAPRRGARLLRRYVDRVLARAVVDPVVAGAWGAVVGLQAPPSSLLRPALAWRVLVRRSGATPPRSATTSGAAPQPSTATATRVTSSAAATVAGSVR